MIYGVTSLTLVVILLLATIAGTFLQLISSDLDMFSLLYLAVFSLVYVVVLYLLAKRTLRIVRGDILLSARQDLPGRLGFYLGAALVLVAAVSLVGTTVLLIWLAAGQASGVPVGTGYGLAIMTFLPGAALLELCKEPVAPGSQ